ncbi:mitogen-activated protein kinase kinase 10-like [Carica papaya]|uniref:mitogen-activated protein kinase kinase 10-like n=1 Tax=Carica papaya TaxID=3649 RepID=UPI000B8C9FF7|nr:mitogen-activated protein kinase kinase 10-like [Carica papaya]
MAGSGCTWETCMGTCAYMSPERVDPERWSDGSSNSNAGFAGDVWSLGVVVLECMVGHYPLIRVGEKPDWAALAYSICFEDRVEMPEKASVEFGNFVRVCLEKDWRKRATVDDLLLHPFLKNSCEKRSRSVLALNKTITLDNRR